MPPQSGQPRQVEQSFRRCPTSYLLYALAAYFSLLLNALGPALPLLREDLQLSYAASSLHMSAFALGMMAAGLAGDRVIRRLGRSAVLWGGGAGLACGALVLLSAPSATLTLSGALLMGAAGSLIPVVVSATLTELHQNHRATALSEVAVVGSLAATLAPLVMGLSIRAGLGWRGALLLPPILFLLLAARYGRQALPAPEPLKGRPSIKRAGLPKAYWLFWGVLVLVVAVEFCIISWGAELLISAGGVNAGLAATLMSLFLAAMLVGRTVGSWLARRGSSVGLFFSALGMAGAGFLLSWLAPGAPLMVLGLIICGLGVANFYPLALSMAVSAAPGQSDTASARATLASGTAILSMPLLLGSLADWLGLWQAYSLIGALILAALAMTLVARRQETRGVQAPTTRGTRAPGFESR